MTFEEAKKLLFDDRAHWAGMSAENNATEILIALVAEIERLSRLVDTVRNSTGPGR